MADIISLPKFSKQTTRERLAEIKAARRKYVVHPVVKLSVYKGLVKTENLLRLAAKREESDPSHPNNPSSPRGKASMKNEKTRA